MTSADPDLTFNGIDGATGEPLYPPVSVAEMSALTRGNRPDPRQADEAIAWREEVTRVHLGLREGFDAKDLSSAGWAAVFPRDAHPAVRDALAPLLEHRRQQASAQSERRYRELTGESGHSPGESKLGFLRRFKVGPAAADPDRMPYYLLLVGSPEEIPWSFQHQLETQYAVGRLCFDTPEEYALYAQTVIAAETGSFARPRRITLFGARNPDDSTTQLMADHLIRPLAAALQEREGDAIETVPPEEATKERLAGLLGGAASPALLFTATHGMGFSADDPRQRPHQGALLCQDWLGPRAAPGPVAPECFMAGEDVAGDSPPAGLIAFFYACHGMGLPQYDAYPQRARSGETALMPGGRRLLASRPFTASLPRRLLSHPKGGALAVIGHVERTWGYSFLWEGAGSQSQVFEDTLLRLLAGYPVGAALEPFALRHGELAADLTATLEAAGFDEPIDEKELIRLWTAHNDARAYALLGDPAVRWVAPSPAPA